MARQAIGMLLAILAILSPLLIHLLLIRGHASGSVANAVMLTQLVLAASFVSARLAPGHRGPLLAAFAVGGFGLVATHPAGGLVVASAAPHALAYAMLLSLFGASLRAGNEPIVTTFARIIHGPPGPAIAAYTRKVTWVWCGFFGMQLLGSALLLAFAQLAWWSLFVNVLNAPLVALMFVVERLGRPLWLTDAPHERWSEMIGMFRTLGRDGLP
ncbi:MAG: hypothetical protein HY749_14495 [Gammaproteobacteria bacterium]|nr:hypothetical protein [Gammaproteobacteria bacterium]MBI5615123.1 hypothetical protein [Gammaproteobacteria bacterium]